MKFDLDKAITELTLLQREMGAEEEPELPKDIDIRLRDDGIETDIADVVGDAEGRLKWHGQVVVLYIADQYVWDGEKSGYRFHIANCSTLLMMRSHGRGERYVVTHRSDGLFPVNQGTRWGTKLISMLVCRNCLSRTNWENYRHATGRERDRIVETFDIGEFFSTYKDVKVPNGSLKGTPPTQIGEGTQTTTGAKVNSPGLSESKWAYSIADAQFRQVALHIERFGKISESELIDMVGGARRARRFAISLEEWFLGAPFSVEVRSQRGVKAYFRTAR